MLELMFIQSAVLLCSSSKKNHDSSQKSSITAPGEAVQEKRRVHMLWYKNENLVSILDKPILKVLFLVKVISFCRFVTSHQITSYPAKGAICGMFDGLIEEIRKDRNKGQSGR